MVKKKVDCLRQWTLVVWLFDIGVYGECKHLTALCGCSLIQIEESILQWSCVARTISHEDIMCVIYHGDK